MYGSNLTITMDNLTPLSHEASHSLDQAQASFATTTKQSDLPGTSMTLVLAALLLSVIVIGQTISSHASAYFVAQNEYQTYLDASKSSVEENESFDRDIGRLQVGDRPRLIRLLNEIQKCGDDLMEDLSRLRVEESKTQLKTTSLVFWKWHRERLEGRLRRLDLLRMRFLVLHMGLIAGGAIVPDRLITSHGDRARSAEARLAPKGMFARPARPFADSGGGTASSITDSIREAKQRRPQMQGQAGPTRRVTNPSMPSSPLVGMGHGNSEVGFKQTLNFNDVIGELKNSAKLKSRKESTDRLDV